MSTAWPAPHNPEHLFAKALLIHGPLPTDGWSVMRGRHGNAVYITARGIPSRRFCTAVIDMFSLEVQNVYAMRGWSAGHCENVARSWKNLLLVWIWEKVDESD